MKQERASTQNSQSHFFINRDSSSEKKLCANAGGEGHLSQMKTSHIWRYVEHKAKFPALSYCFYLILYILSQRNPKKCIYCFYISQDRKRAAWLPQQPVSNQTYFRRFVTQLTLTICAEMFSSCSSKIPRLARKIFSSQNISLFFLSVLPSTIQTLQTF